MDKAHRQTDLVIEEIEAKYEKFYRKKQAQIQLTIDNYLKKFKRQDEKWRKDVEKGLKTEKQYQAWRKAHIARGKKYKQMQKQIAEQLNDVNQTAARYANDKLAEVYSINYNAVSDEANTIQGYSFNLVNKDVVNSLAENDSRFLPYKKLDKAKDIAWNMRQINNQISQAIRKGESIPEMRKRIIGLVGNHKAAATRTARTICTSAENKARQDSYKKMQDDGVIMKKKWIATHDSRTRDWHYELDGQMVGVDEPFVNAYGEIRYPADPAVHPANVYNCRCTLGTKIIGFRKVR